MKKYEIGMVGLGIMGRNLTLNMANHGHSVAVYDKDQSKVETLQNQAGDREIQAAQTLDELVGLLQTPRAVMMMVPAGASVDAVIHSLLPYLQEDDLVIDGGDSHYADTDLRTRKLFRKGIHYLGVGISGGASSARHGPSMMPGGPKEGYERVKSIFEAIAAHVYGDPCVAYLGPGSAGHYVKMVHNGIEYGLMQLIAESYDLMKRGLCLSNDELHDIFNFWNRDELSGYLVGITADIFLKKDKISSKRLIDFVLDKVEQRGTGRWTSQDAMELGVAVPTIDIAVAMRNLSAVEEERLATSRVLSGPEPLLDGDLWDFVEQLRHALYAAMIITYAQGMAQLWVASQHYGYGLDLEAVTRTWRGGCIIQCALLERMRVAYQANPDLPNLLLDPELGQAVELRQENLRAVVRSAAERGIPTPGLMVSLAYFDSYRSAWLPANLLQAQRDLFGAHTYERIDQKGAFHTQWVVE